MDFSSPQIGDIVVFHPPKDYADGCADPNEGENQAGQDAPAACEVPWTQPSSQTFIKRVVGLPGDRISIRNGHVIRNGTREKDRLHRAVRRRVRPATSRSTITMPQGDYYMMGDNRPDSEDSRFWGPVPQVMDHRQGLLDLLAAGPDRFHVMTRSTGGSRPVSRRGRNEGG